MHERNRSAKNDRRDSRDRYKGYPYANKKGSRTFRNRQLRRTERADVESGGVWGKAYNARVRWDIY